MRKSPKAVTRARTAVAIGIAIALASVGSIASAQAPAAQCNTAEIHWLNPDEDTSADIVSFNSFSGGNSQRSYDLIAWVDQVPEGAQVDFDADTPGGFTYFDNFSFTQQTTAAAHVDVATNVAPTGQIYTASWDTTSVGYNFGHGEPWTLTATLSLDGDVCATDTETHPVSDNDFGETGLGAPPGVVLTKPRTGDQLGFLINPDGSSAAPISVSTNAFSMETPTVRLQYSTSAVGDEPTWQTCGGGNIAFGSTSGQSTFTCTLVGSDVATDVTAIAASATPQFGGGTYTGSDASALADGFVITPTTITVEFLNGDPTTSPNVLSQVAFNQCTDVLQAVVEDQNGDPIPHVNLDIHALGPSDRLRFGSTAAVDAFQAPDTGDHDTENVANCPNGTGTSGTSQGDHDLVDRADIKHIESSGNTDLSGEFKWTMFLGGSSQAGDTAIEVWVDHDDNDTHCAQELSADAGIAWGDGNRVFEADVLPQEDACPTPAPLPQPTPTPSPTPTPTSTPTPFPTPTASPTPSPTPSPTTTPPVPTPVPVHTIVSIHKGFIGSVGSEVNNSVCERKRRVVLRKVRPGKDRTVGKDTTNNSGGWAIKRKRKGRYYAVAKTKTAGGSIGPPLICKRAKSIKLRAK